MRVSVVSRSGKPLLKEALELPDQATAGDLQQEIFKHNKKWTPVRQRLTLPHSPSAPSAKPTVLNPKKRLAEYATEALRDAPAGTLSLAVVLKDLGPQIGYRTVFFWEYFGPLAIYPLFYFFPRMLYPVLGIPLAAVPERPQHAVQGWALALWSAHYAKRIAETFLVHRFSHGSMPLFNLFRNCAYYWLFAAWVSFFVNHPRYTPVPPPQAALGLGLAVAAEVCNFVCHWMLRGLRPSSSSTAYVIPKGFLFDYITCPNYTAEILAWLGFSIMTQTLAGYAFMLAGAYQMTMWALQKHTRLRKLFDGKEGREKYPRRWVILPPLL